MIKIGILTFHRSYNYGAFMQCYSLQKRISEDFPECKVEVIDYCTRRVYDNYPRTVSSFVLGSKQNRNSLYVSGRKLAKLIGDPRYLRSKNMLYDAFDKSMHYLPLSEKKIISDEYEELFKYIDSIYDIVIVGSDGVWEFKSYSFPNAYFMNYPFQRTTILSYAATCDRMHISQINDTDRIYLKESFNRFKYLGIRDVSTESFVHGITDKRDYQHNCDPTLLLDLNQIPVDLSRVKGIMEKNGIDLKKPIIGLMGNNKMCSMIKNFLGHKYKIVSVYEKVTGSDCHLDDLSPLEWAKVFSLFSITVTKYFHGSILSLLNGIPTIATDYWYKVTEDHETKIGDLYTRLNLREHYFFNPAGNESEIKRKMEYFIEHPDTDKIDSALQCEARSYLSFKGALEKLVKGN